MTVEPSQAARPRRVHYIRPSFHNPGAIAMPIRTASLTPQIKKNGAVLHHAMASRIQSHGADAPASALEQKLLEERRQLKAEKTERAAKAAAPVRKVKVVKATKPPKAPVSPRS